MLKKVYAIILALSFSLSMASPLKALELTTRTNLPINQNDPIQHGDIPENNNEEDWSTLPPDIEPLPEEDLVPANTNIQSSSFSSNEYSTNSTKVAEVRIFASNAGNDSSSSLNTEGHAFLVIYNRSSSNINIGGLYIAPNKGVSIGTWGNKSEHSGLWFCLEGYFRYHNTAYKDSYSMGLSVTQTGLDKINEIIKTSDKWTYLNNCSSFATRVWNAISSTKLNAGSPNTPAALKRSIASYGTSYYVVNASIPHDYTAYYGQPPTQSKTYK